MLKRKNDRQPPQRLEEERYPNDYWLDEEDGGEDIPDPAVSSKPVSGRLHSEPMVTGYEALERQRGVRRPNRKLTRREKKALKRAQKYEAKLHKEHEKADKKNAKKEAKLAAKAEKQAMREAKKSAKKKKSSSSTAPPRQQPEGKKVSKVYYIDDNDKLHELKFVESNGVVTFKMGSVSLYNNVIVYGGEKLQAKGVSLSKTAYTYSGKAKKPAVTVTFDGKKLKAGSDYTVSYSANKNVGKAKAVVTGKGKYEGTITKTFKINPKGTSIKHLKKGVRAFKPTWKKQTKQISGYQVQYSTKKSFKSAKIKNVSSKKKSTWVIKQKRHKKYYVRIRTYKKVGGSKYYSKWSSAKSIKTK